MPVYVSFAAGLELKVRAVLSISDRADHVESPPPRGGSPVTEPPPPGLMEK